MPPSACQWPVPKMPGCGARSGFRQGCEKHRNGYQERGQQRKRRARGGFSRGVTRPRLLVALFRVCVVAVIACAFCRGLGSGVAHASFHGWDKSWGQEKAIVFMFFLGRARGFVLSTGIASTGIGSCALADVGTPHRRHRIVRGQGGFKNLANTLPGPP